jgi:cytochrome c oxidase subunit 2
MGRALAILIWLLTLGTVLLFTNGKWWFPKPISEHGPAYDRQFMLTIIVVGVAFAAAQIGLGIALWRYRSTDQKSERAVYSHGNNRLEIVWTVITALVFISLGVLGQSVWAKLHFNPANPDAYRVEVFAQQFQWNFHYAGKDNLFGRTDPTLIKDAELNFVGLDPNDPNAKDDAVVTSLVVPVNHQVELMLHSKDVTHSFWVPPLRFKQDLVPGMVIKVHFTPTQVGKYELACAELCGALHFKMKSQMLVLPEDEQRALAALPQAQFQVKMTELLNKYPFVY